MTSPTPNAKLALAAWLETHTAFRLPAHANDLKSALNALDSTPEPTSYSAQFASLKRYFNRAIVVLMMFCALLGFMAVPPAFSINQSNQANIFWLFIILLGFHMLNLAVWTLTMLTTMKQQANSKGMLLSLLIFINNKVSKHSHIEKNVSAAYLHWQCPNHTNKWLISSLSHGAWGCYLLAGWIMTLLLLLTNQINFVWETTLLSDEAFIKLTQTLSVIPQWFGISLPNQLDILASRVDLISQTAATRQHWANFLLASIMIYGVFPRVFLTLVCLSIYRVKRAMLPLSTQERIIKNRYRQPESQSRHILDTEHNSDSQAGGEHISELRSELPKSAFLQHWALFEWSTETPRPLHPAKSLTMLNSREEQSHFLEVTHNEPMYLLVNAQQSPDRGTRRFLRLARGHYPSLNLVLYDAKNSAFQDDWQRLARETRVPSTSLQSKD
ncbi:DUF2868 domain-containing protein [Marinomonas foliarum]|uniref:Uncharacterized protein DUF2868 n=1 Tax=Marinomonas foliarum TaxID=491950 RepID=A0A369AC33_9GAMM|nr:DUF2868 domain-containing protein [Marinomonas foliarum]RCX06685.1 uncharacterized protein DUF2868 [Marinomonas foliarum]